MQSASGPAVNSVLMEAPVIPTRRERLEGGLVGLLVGDALGVPYEFRHPSELPAADLIEMRPPPGFFSHHGSVPPGTWSDDGSQALCLLSSLWECGGLDVDDFGQRLIAWMGGGYMAVDSRPFDVGSHESEALTNFKAGIPASRSGLTGENSNGPGSLMRVLPLTLLWKGDDASLADAAHRQSSITHAHPRSMVCCALYSLWARRELDGADHGWERAVDALREIYGPSGEYRRELEESLRPEDDSGVFSRDGAVACLHKARLATMEPDFESTARRAILFGHDTDTTASLACGIAGVRLGVQGVTERWWKALRGKQILVPILERWLGRV